MKSSHTLIITVAASTKMLVMLVEMGLIDPSWRSVGQRCFGIMFGTTLMAFGNYLPKLRPLWSLKDEPFDWQGVHRFCGWVFSLVGLTFVVLWISLPITSVKPAVLPLILAMIVLCAGRKFYSLATWQRHKEGR